MKQAEKVELARQVLCTKAATAFLSPMDPVFLLMSYAMSDDSPETLTVEKVQEYALKCAHSLEGMTKEFAELMEIPYEDIEGSAGKVTEALVSEVLGNI